MGFAAVRRIRSGGVHITPKVPPVGLRSAFRDSHPLRGLLLLRPCEFVSPRKRPSAFPSGVSLSRSRRSSSLLPYRHAVAPAAAHPLPRYSGTTGAPTTTPRQWSGCLWPTSRFSSPRESVPEADGFSIQPPVDPLLVFSLSRVFPAVAMRAAHHRRSSRTLYCSFRSIRLAGWSGKSCASEYHSPQQWLFLSRGCRPLLRFLAAARSPIHRRWILAYRFASSAR